MYKTPDAPTTLRRVRRVLRVPADEDILALINGALTTLVYKSSWEKQGGLSEDEAARFFSRLFRDTVMSTFLIGAIVPYLGGQPPEGVIACEGQTLLASEYPELHEIVGETFKTATTITLPDLRGKFVFGAGLVGSDFYAIGDTGGNNKVTLGSDNLPAHAHETAPHSHSSLPHSHGYTSAAIVPNILGVEPSIAGVVPVPAVTSPATVTLLAETVTVLPTGNGVPVETMPPFVALKWGIVAW